MKAAQLVLADSFVTNCRKKRRVRLTPRILVRANGYLVLSFMEIR